MTIAAPAFDDNPCRPRHFKPAPCAPVVPEGPAIQALETCRSRLVVAWALFALLFMAIAIRLVDVSLFTNAAADLHIARFRPVTAPPPSRADILDRNGKLLATSLDSPSLYADPKEIVDPSSVAERLAATLSGLSRGEIYAKLTSGKSFVWLKRQLTPSQQYRVNALGIPGLGFEHAERRVYPYGNLLAHVVGYSGVDNVGFAGIERGLNGVLKGRQHPLDLSIDLRVQYILHEELQRVIDDFTAKAGAGIVMNVNTGEILAMVSLPDFDPNHPEAGDPTHPGITLADRLFNRATLGEYEVGSVFKIFNTAMALDSGVSTMTSRYDAVHPIHIGRFTITDYHGKHRWLSVPEIFMYSSNIGSARMAVAAGADLQREYLARFGFLRPEKLELDELGSPHFPNPWREVNVMTIAFGHGISVTLLQVATAASAMVDGGILHPATLLKLPSGYEPPGRRVISAKTSEEMRKLLRLVVEHGTARFAEVPGYVVGGKTGTAEEVRGGRYALKKLRSTFVGVFPMNAPKYLVLMMVDQPHGNKESHGFATAGWTVVPATAHVIERIAPLLGVPPVDETSPAIQNALMVESLQGQKIENY